MGIYYNYAVVHGRVLVWWTDNNCVPHSKWIEDSAAGEKFLDDTDSRDFKTQTDLANLVKIKD